jgi:hypothetical protein
MPKSQKARILWGFCARLARKGRFMGACAGFRGPNRDIARKIRCFRAAPMPAGAAAKAWDRPGDLVAISSACSNSHFGEEHDFEGV